MIMRRVLKWLSSILSVLFYTALITVGLLVISTTLSGGKPELFGYQIKTVLSGSMEPGIQTGSIIIIESVTEEEKNSLIPGDVITFLEDQNTLITHRITEVNQTDNNVLYTTKGDNNNAIDRNPVLAENIVGLYTGITIPMVGYAVSFLQSPQGIILCLIIPGILMLGYSIFNIWRVMRSVEKQMKPESAE